ncbi:uncharacterized protein TrAFT101_005771 [Trichoderma asperellum]|uniref:uncharacterized protein n=1 Tax=Trichoderma asperellum TaxID=101201 RepID=UPI00331C8278|nr:hypothetical protein TrAFT101_005771 [Trichoderma asperellum]
MWTSKGAELFEAVSCFDVIANAAGRPLFARRRAEHGTDHRSTASASVTVGCVALQRDPAL